jgi:DNA-binding CsgD family transcriptional regulator
MTMAFMSDDRFVGRRAELARLRELVAGVAQGSGRVVVVEGEQGIGKSALLRAGLAGAAAAGCSVLWGTADELDQRFPLRLMARCLGDAGRVPAAPAGALSGGDPVLAGMEQLLAAIDRLCAVSPVVLVTEDLQWADEASALMWYRLSRAVRQLPLLLAGSWRPDPAQEHLAQLRRGATSQDGHVVTLGELPDAEVAELLGTLVGGRPGRRLNAVIGRAGGNPLYARELAEELVRAGRVGVAAGEAELAAGVTPVQLPVSLVAAAADRLAALAGNVTRVLRWAAVLGQEFSVTDLQIVAGRTAGELMEVVAAATAAGVVAGVGPRLRFRHGLIWQALYEEMPAALRAALHLQAAQALAQAGAAPERVAAQLVSGRGPDDGTPDRWAADWLADHVSVLTYRAPLATSVLLPSVLASLPDTDSRRESLEVSRVTVAFLLMRDDEVERAGGRLLARLADPDRAAEIAWLVACTLLRGGRHGEAEAAISAALQRPGVSQRRAAMLRALHANVLMGSGQHERAAQAATTALASAERAGSRVAAGYARQALASISLVAQGDRLACLRQHTQALDAIGTDPRAADLRMLLLASQAAVLEELDRPAEALAAARAALVIAEQVRTPRLTAIRCLLAYLYFRGGRWDDAVAELDGLADTGADPQLPVWMHGVSALITGHRDGWELAREHLRAAPDPAAGPAAARLDAAHLLLARALAAERERGPGEAAAILAGVLEPGAAPAAGPRYLLLPELTRLALASGNPPLAAAAAAAAAADAAREPLAVAAAAADVCRGLAGHDAAPVLAAAAYYARAGRPHEQASALEDAAVLAAAGSRPDQARDALAAAIGLYQGLGARWDVRRAALRLRRYGIKRSRSGYRARPVAGWDALTPTEEKVAYLVAAGRANPDIAAELFLSRNTVQTHVSHILAKLGTRSRADIIRQIFPHPPPDQPYTA